jgi:hypothetical protein
VITLADGRIVDISQPAHRAEAKEIRW